MTERRKPSHRLCLQPDAEKDFTIEVGALWPHEKGGGFGITLKRGIALYAPEGARIIAFAIREDEGKSRADEPSNGRTPQSNRQRSDRGWDQPGHRARGEKDSRDRR
jgi:hypothetical protein